MRTLVDAEVIYCSSAAWIGMMLLLSTIEGVEGVGCEEI